ncbi:hypothetical protein [Pseudomonas fluorescens]|uniref:Uncharacterized protein n=1 Tax=Pseudomonas fluorescens TaxID=294 RepID=A0A0F4T3E8_PSEFL|nr:hypothetical protein [Pseudomonas fluorescens]KJZ38991.1 hypothetical protein VC34_23020 [Pseudomonas fluorescens]
MDFTRDSQEFSGFIQTVKRDWNRALTEFMVLVDHWRSIATEYHQGLVEIGLTEENVINGNVLGKPFLIELVPFAKDQVGCAEVILSASKSGCASVELSRFYFYRDGRIVGPNGAVLIDSQADRHSYSIYTAILRTVLEAPAAARD